MPRLSQDRGQGRGRVNSCDAKKTAKGRSGGRTPSEDRERAFVAASRRSDRSAEARLESANMASKVHFQRTGRYLKITPQIVENGEQYESDDDVSRRIRVNQALGPSAAAQSHINHTVNDPDFLLREQQVNSEFDQVFGQLPRLQPVPYPQLFGEPVPSHGNQRGMSYTPPCSDSITAAPQQPPYHVLQGMNRQSAPSTAQPSPAGSPYAASYGAFGSPALSFVGYGSPPPQAAPQRRVIRSHSAATSTTYADTPELIHDSSATPSSGGSPFDYLAIQTDGVAEQQPAGPTYHVEGMLADPALSAQVQGNAGSIQDFPLFPGSSIAPASGTGRKRPSSMMEGQASCERQVRHPSPEQFAFSRTMFAPVTQAEQQGLEKMMGNQEMFSQATQLNQLDAQYTNLSRQASPHGIEFTDPFAEFTNGDGL